MPKDPVCGMEVEEKNARHKLQYRSRTYCFCTERCKEAFEDDPEKYLRESEADLADRRKVAIVGTGQVGSTFAFALMISGLASSIVLIDQRAELAEGHVMDLNHGLSFVSPSRIFAGDYSDCKDASIVVVTAGAAQKPGETRLELVRKNTDIFKTVIPEIVRYNPRILLIVSNPVDVLTYVALKVSNYPMNRVIGSGTTLDTARFRYLLSSHCAVDPRNVHAYIVGEHGDSEVPVWSQASIGGVSFLDFCTVCETECPEDEREQIFKQVRNAAYEIINKKGSTYFAIALALVRIAGSILRDENSVLTVSALVDGYYDVSNVCLSVPVILNGNGISRILRIALDESEIKRLQASAAVLKDVIRTLEL
ncbi:MAG TPA: L-lactate dehydrogenase [Desulfatiglandales bacterium]|nr:L-lactate dehydrogenase [Desulfatiglandales bacterium]